MADDATRAKRPAVTILREWVFWPPTPVPWAAGIAAFALLSLYGFQRVPIIDSAVKPSLNLPQRVPLICLVSVMNAIILWSHVRPHYLTAARARPPFVTTFLILSGAYYLLYRFFADPTTSGSWLTLLMVSQLGVYLTGVASQLWNVQKPSFGQILDSRRVALALLDAWLDGQPVTRDDKSALDVALAYLGTKASDLTTTMRLDLDRDTVLRWARASARMFQGLQRIDSQDVTPGLLQNYSTSIAELRHE